jgi:hypothetical protein
MARVRLWSAILAAGLLSLGCDARMPLCPDVYSDAQIPVPATSVTFAPSVHAINASSTSAGDGIMVSIANSQGTIAFGGRGPAPAFLYGSAPYVAAHRTLYLGLAVTDGAWLPFDLYCSSDGRLTDFAGEMTDRDVAFLEPVEGTCTDAGLMSTMTVEIAAHTVRHVALSCGFTVDGQGVSLRGSQVGTLSLLGDSAQVYPFHAVDCRQGCGSVGWYELHSVIWDPVKQIAGFAIFYLYEPGVFDSSISLSDGVLLPNWSLVISNQIPNSSWTLSR